MHPPSTAVVLGVLLWSVALMARAVGSTSADAPVEWQASLDPGDPAAARGPDDAFVIRLSAPYDPVEGRLALELDRIDVTSAIRPLDASYTVFELVPYAPLERGEHELRLVEYRSDGAIVERGRWTFAVNIVERELQPAMNVSPSYRVDQDPEEPFTSSAAQAQGSLNLTGYTDNGQRRFMAAGDLLVDTNTITGAGDERRAVDVGEFLFSRDSRHVNLSAGHHYPGAVQGLAQGNLVFDGYVRRGVSATLRSEDRGMALTGFVLRTESIRGFEHGLGVGDSENRIEGGMLRIQPTSHVALNLGYVDGEGRQAGFGTIAPDSELSGDAGNLIVDSHWFEQRLSLRGEAAFSRVDLGTGFGEVSDQAYAAGLSYQPHQGFQLGEQFLLWRLDVNYTQIGALFRSIASLGQAADIEEYRAGLTAYLGGLSINVSGARIEDNLESELYPGARADVANFGLTWAPQVDSGFGGWLFARPSFGLTFLSDDRETVRQPPESIALRLDTDTRAYSAFASFNHPRGPWTLSYGTTWIDDRTDAMPDFHYQTIGLQTSLQFGDRYSLTPGVQYDIARDRDDDVSRRTTNVNLGQTWLIVRDRLQCSLSLGYSQNRTSDNSFDQRYFVGNATLVWFKGPLAVWLQASYADTRDEVLDPFTGVPSLLADATHQVFLGASFNWPQAGMQATSAPSARTY
jgi:hypothetical protein